MLALSFLRLCIGTPVILRPTSCLRNIAVEPEDQAFGVQVLGLRSRAGSKPGRRENSLYTTPLLLTDLTHNFVPCHLLSAHLLLP